MDKFKLKEMKKKRPVKNNLFDCLINYIPEPITKTVDGFKLMVVSYFKTNTLQNYSKKIQKNPNKPKTQKQSEENVTKIIKNFFKLKNKTKHIKILGLFSNEQMIIVNQIFFQ